jgi:hypothetical protein
MRSEHPPVVATWLLERFCADVALAGDLVEQYREGKSIRWYWKQAIAAVSVYSVSQILEHKWLAVRAIATGYVIWYLLNNMFLHGVLRPVMDDGALRVAYIFIGYAFWIANGWIIARLHRPYSTAMVMAYVLWAIVASVPPVYAAVNAIGSGRCAPRGRIGAEDRERSRPADASPDSAVSEGGPLLVITPSRA